MEIAVKKPDLHDKRYIEIDSAETVVTIVPIGDTHWENRGCEVQALRDCIQWIKNEPNCYAVMMGDLLDCTPQDHKFYHPGQLRKEFTEDNVWDSATSSLAHELKPIRDKILGVMTGNHDWRLESKYGINTTQIMCNLLNDDLVDKELRSDYRQVEKFKISKTSDGHPKAVKNYRYCSAVSLTFGLKTKKQVSSGIPRKSIKMWFHHGAGGGGTQGAVVNKLVKMSEHFEGIDIFVMGHHHKEVVARTSCFSFTHKGDLTIREKLFVVAPAFLNSYYEGHSDYAERGMFPPATIGWVPIRIKPFNGHNRNKTKFWAEV